MLWVQSLRKGDMVDWMLVHALVLPPLVRPHLTELLRVDPRPAGLEERSSAGFTGFKKGEPREETSLKLTAASGRSAGTLIPP